MAKAIVTAKWLKDNYTCIGTDYCSIQALMRYEEPQYYTCGSNGWGCDAYIPTIYGKNVCITMGNKPVSTVDVDARIVNEYEKRSQKLDEQYYCRYAEEDMIIYKAKKQILVVAFVKEVLK
jgi:hypothetical protein